ncbi:MAG: sodium:calcium antiporter [Bacilli bacterium]
MILLAFFLCAAVVVFFAIKLSDSADWFEKNTKLTGALVGFLLAAVTSLPELISGITSIFIKQEELAISSILGSNLFNYNIVVVANLAFIGYMAFNKLDKNVNKIVYFILSMYVVIIAGLIIGSIFGIPLFDFRISIISILIILIYIWSVRSIEDDSEETKEYAPKSIVRKKIYLSVLFIIILIISSSLLAKIVEEVMYEIGLSASLAGSILLGASTSLPEFVGAITLMRKRQYNVAVSSVLSSNLFNFSVLFILDIFTKKTILTYFTNDIFILLIFGVVNTLIILFAIKFYKVKSKFLYMIPSVMVLVVYLSYLLMN